MSELTRAEVSKPHLLAVLPCFAGGGAERVTLNLLNELVRQGNSVGLITLDSKGPLRSLLADEIHLTNLGKSSLRRSLLALIREIRRQQPRVVYTTFGYVNLALLGLRNFLPAGTKIWIREANLPSLSLPNNLHPRLMKLGYRLLYPTADRVLSTSARMRDELIKEFDVSDRKLELVYNPIDEDSIRQQASGQAFPLRTNRRYIAAGRLTRQKGFDRLLELFALDPDRSSELLIAGNGPEFVALKSQVVDLGLQSRVRFLGFVENPWIHIAEADAFLLPSRWEGMPNVALEALACGTPVIATPESGGIEELKNQAPKGAITVVNFGTPFAAAMRAAPQWMGGSLRPSLLPSEYLLQSAVRMISDWIHNEG